MQENTIKFNPKYKKTKKALAISSLCFFSLVLFFFLFLNGLAIDMTKTTNLSSKIFNVYYSLTNFLDGLSLLALTKVIDSSLIAASATTGNKAVYAIIFIIYFALMISLIVMSSLSISNKKSAYNYSIITGVLILIYGVMISGGLRLVLNNKYTYIGSSFMSSIVFILFGSSMIFIGYNHKQLNKKITKSKTTTVKK